MSNLRTFNPYKQTASDIAGIEDELHGGNWRVQKMCWRCQRDKYTKGGSLTLLGGRGGVMRFICRDCLALPKLAA